MVKGAEQDEQEAANDQDAESQGTSHQQMILEGRSARIVRHTVNLACTPKRTAGSYTPKRKRLTIRLTGNERKMKKRNRRG